MSNSNTNGNNNNGKEVRQLPLKMSLPLPDLKPISLPPRPTSGLRVMFTDDLPTSSPRLGGGHGGTTTMAAAFASPSPSPPPPVSPLLPFDVGTDVGDVVGVSTTLGGLPVGGGAAGGGGNGPVGGGGVGNSVVVDGSGGGGGVVTTSTIGRGLGGIGQSAVSFSEYVESELNNDVTRFRLSFASHAHQHYTPSPLPPPSPTTGITLNLPMAKAVPTTPVPLQISKMSTTGGMSSSPLPPMPSPTGTITGVGQHAPSLRLHLPISSSPSPSPPPPLHHASSSLLVYPKHHVYGTEGGGRMQPASFLSSQVHHHHNHHHQQSQDHVQQQQAPSPPSPPLSQQQEQQQQQQAPTLQHKAASYSLQAQKSMQNVANTFDTDPFESDDVLPSPTVESAGAGLTRSETLPNLASESFAAGPGDDLHHHHARLSDGHMRDADDAVKDHVSVATQEALDAQHRQARIGWMRLDCLQLDDVGKVCERSMTRAELMQEARDTGAHPFSSVDVPVELLPQQVVVDPMHMQSQHQQRQMQQQQQQQHEHGSDDAQRQGNGVDRADAQDDQGQGQDGEKRNGTATGGSSETSKNDGDDAITEDKEDEEDDGTGTGDGEATEEKEKDDDDDDDDSSQKGEPLRRHDSQRQEHHTAAPLKHTTGPDHLPPTSHATWNMLTSTSIPVESRRAWRDYLRNSLQLRDIRQVDPAFAAKPALWVRHTAIVVSLDGLRAIILFNKMFVFEPGREESHQLMEVASKCVTRMATDGDRPQPFEFHALEGLLIFVAMRLDREFSQFKPYVEVYLHQLPNKLSTKMLEELRKLKQHLKQLMLRANSVKAILEGLLDDDDEMANMYLSEKHYSSCGAAGPPRDSDEHSEVEVLLETYLQVIDEIVNSAQLLDDAIDDTEGLVQIHLDTLRNHLLTVELSLSVVTMMCTCGSVISGVFGMNFPLIDDKTGSEGWFWGIAVVIVMIIIGPSWVILNVFRRRGLAG